MLMRLLREAELHYASTEDTRGDQQTIQTSGNVSWIAALLIQWRLLAGIMNMTKHRLPPRSEVLARRNISHDHSMYFRIASTR